MSRSFQSSTLPMLPDARVSDTSSLFGGALLATGVGTLVCVLILTASDPAFAQSTVVPSTTVPPATTLPAPPYSNTTTKAQWFDGTWTLGAGVGVGNSIYKGADDEVSPILMLSFDSERLHVGVDGIAAKVVTFGDTVALSALVGYDGKPFKPKDSSMLNGLHKRKDAISGGLSLDYISPIGGLTLTWETDLNNAHDGHSVDLSYAWQYERERWFAGFDAGVTWQSAKLVDYNVGVRPNEARADRRAYNPGDAFIPHLGLSAGYALTSSKTWWLDAGVDVQILPKEYTDSPIVDTDAAVTGMVGVRYQF